MAPLVYGMVAMDTDALRVPRAQLRGTDVLWVSLALLSSKHVSRMSPVLLVGLRLQMF